MILFFGFWTLSVSSFWWYCRNMILFDYFIEWKSAVFIYFCCFSYQHNHHNNQWTLCFTSFYPNHHHRRTFTFFFLSAFTNIHHACMFNFVLSHIQSTLNEWIKWMSKKNRFKIIHWRFCLVLPLVCLLYCFQFHFVVVFNWQIVLSV